MTNKASTLDANTFHELVSSDSPTSKFSDLLIASGYSTIIENIEINLSQANFVDFSDCHFNNITITGNLQHAIFDDVSFNNVRFDHADLSMGVFNETSFNHCTLTESKFSQASFNNATLNHNKIYDCDFSNCSFAQTALHDSLFANSNLENALDYNNILIDTHKVYTQQYHYDYVFQNAQAHLIQPTIVIVDDSKWYGTPYYILCEYGAIPTTLAAYNDEINDTILADEINTIINDIKLYGLQANSIAEQVINANQPTIQAIKAYAYQMMQKADALWIPGGPDLHPEFYNESNTDSYPNPSYYREILEFSLAQAAISMNKPILGICHGSQLMNVFLGGSLYQHVETPYGFVEITADKKEGLLGSVIEDDFIGPSYHHQAVKDVASSLEVVATYEGIVKATQANDGKPIMLCQFHPEYEADQSSINILNQFVNISSEQQIQDTILQLWDVIDCPHPFTDTTSPTSFEALELPLLPISSVDQHLPTIGNLIYDL